LPLDRRSDGRGRHLKLNGPMHVDLLSPIRVVQRQIWMWWDTTSDPKFLQSDVSLRRRWWWLLPCMALLTLATDCSSALVGHGTWSWVAVDGVFVVAAMAFSSSQALIGKLYVDSVLTAGFIIGAWCTPQSGTYATGAGHDSDYMSCFSGPFGYLLMMVFTHFVGLHTVVLPFICLSCMATVLTTLTLAEAIPMLFLSVSTAAGCCSFEFAVAYLYRELQSQLECNRLLLDTATDGFGVVDSEDGLLVSASPKMLQTFRCSDMLGLSLRGFVVESDHGELARFLCGADAVKGGALVTCSAQTLQFEVRLVPYRMDGSKIAFCVQMVGEPRKIIEERCAAAAVVETQHHSSIERAGFEADDSDGGSSPRILDEAEASGKGKHCSTLSLSNWTVSYQASEHNVVRPPGGSLCVVSTAAQTDSSILDTQESCTQTIRQRPLLMPSSAPNGLAKSAAEGRRSSSRRRARSSPTDRQKRPAVCVREGERAVAKFHPTPQSSRDNSVAQLARHFNVGGIGCCTKHIASAVLLQSVNRELQSGCEEQSYCTDWQCPLCHSLNDWEGPLSEDDFEDEGPEQLCAVCYTIVLPALCSSADAA